MVSRVPVRIRRLATLMSIVTISMACTFAAAAQAQNVQLAQSRSAEWNKQVASIKDTYYGGDPREAINMLETQIEALGPTYSDATLQEIVEMMKEYFGETKDYSRFETMTYAMFKPGKIDFIVNSYKGTLYQKAKAAKTRWLIPKSARLTVEGEELDIGDSTSYSIAVYNQEGIQLSSSGVAIKGTPEGHVSIDEAEKTIAAILAGPVTIEALDKNGASLGKAALTIRDELTVTVTPVHQDLEVKESVDFTIQSNKPFSKFPVEWKLDPSGLTTSKTMQENLDNVIVKVTAKKSGMTTLRVTDEQGGQLAQATVYTPPIPPSKMWPYVTTGATVVFALYAIYEYSNAGSKYDEYEECAGVDGVDAANPDCQNLYNDYESILTRSNIGWVLTGAAAIGAGYLWYRYLGQKKAYDAKLEEGNQSTGLLIDPVNRSVAFSYNF